MLYDDVADATQDLKKSPTLGTSAWPAHVLKKVVPDGEPFRSCAVLWATRTHVDSIVRVPNDVIDDGDVLRN